MGIKRELGLREVGAGFDKKKKIGNKKSRTEGRNGTNEGEVADALTSILPASPVWFFFFVPRSELRRALLVLFPENSANSPMKR